MKILNLYCGIGGNRKLWDDVSNFKITAVEIDEKVAEIYSVLYPNDTVIIGDAHKYLISNYQDFDVIWSSPPCQTHSITNYFLNAQGVVRYPDLKLYEEIILLGQFFKGKYIVENVKSYYDPLIQPQIRGRHYFWANFMLPHFTSYKQIGRMCGITKEVHGTTQGELRRLNLDKLGFDLSEFDYKDKDKLLRNCVAPELGKRIITRAVNIELANNSRQKSIFDEL
jgi:DNA (cytosine-5)-methyltransferase 1